MRTLSLKVSRRFWQVKGFVLFFSFVIFSGCATPAKAASPEARISSLKYVNRQAMHYVGIFTKQKPSFEVAFNKQKAELLITMKNTAFPQMQKELKCDASVIKGVEKEYLIDNDGSVLSRVRISLAKPFKYHVARSSFGIQVAVDSTQQVIR